MWGPAPQPFGIFQGRPVGFAEPPSFRLSRDVCDGMSNRKLATVAVNLLRPRLEGAPSAACLLGARLVVDVALPSTPPRAGRAGRATASSHGVTETGYGARTRQGRHTPRLAPCLPGKARRTPSRLGAPAGSVGRSEAGGVGGCPIRRLGALSSKGAARGLGPVAGRPGAGVVSFRPP